MGIGAEQKNLSRCHAIEIEIAQMGAMAETLLGDAITCFERRDPSMAKSVMAADQRIDAAHRRVEKLAVELLSEGGLSDAEMRAVISAIKVSGELERVGDLAKNTAKRVLVISREPPSDIVAGGVARMGRQSLQQFSAVLDAYGARSTRAAAAVWGADDNIDELYNSLFQASLKTMMEDASRVNACTHLVFVAKNFERVGDHATNIAEALHFLVTGDLIDAVRPKGDETATTGVSVTEHAR